MTERRTPDDPDDANAPEDEEGVEAYESDWYRSLQALSKGEVNQDDEDEADAGDGAEEDADRETASEHEGTEKGTKRTPESGEPGIWVVVTPDK